MSNRKSISKHTRLKVYQKYNGHCAYCGCTLELKDMQVDHIQSVYWYNGANDIENYNPACRMCNFYKSTMSVEDFREQLGKILSRLEKVFIFRLAKKYGLIREIKEPVIFYFEKENLKKVMDFEREKLSLKEKELEKFEKSNNVKSLFVDNPELLEEWRWMDNKLKIREVCGDYALDIPFADGSVNTIYFNSKRNAETVKHIIEIDDSNPKNDLYDYCPKIDKE